MILKIIGAVIVIWLAFSLLGVLFGVLKFLLIAAGVVTIGAIGYSMIKGKDTPKQLRR